jgi:4-amino-4-deoxy-L-arabinose transferase-like glycosyltransferase
VTRETSPPAQRLLLIALAFGIALRVADFFNCRTLSLDEARLAVNIAGRSFRGLLSPLAMDQSAPPLFLWGERVITALFGHSDCALRLLPVVAGTVAAALMYSVAKRFLAPAEARLAAMIGIFCPLLITYSNTVKQYSVELLASMLLLLAWERSLAGHFRGRAALTLVAAGAIAPWMSLTSVFLLGAAWVQLTMAAARRREGAARIALAATLCWGLSALTAYLVVYRAAGGNPYMRRFWEMAFLTPVRPGFPGRLWKSIEDLVWGFVAGDPLLDRRPFLLALHVVTVAVILLCLAGTRRMFRDQGPGAVWMLWGPGVLTLGASMAGVFPIAPRLTLFLLPALIVLLVAGLTEAVELMPLGARRPGLAVAAAVILLPLEF